MKKIYLSLFMVFTLFVSVFAQEEVRTTISVVNKNGQTILPEAGDIAIGADVVPFMNYLGNMFNGDAGNTYGGSFLGGSNTIFIKYFIADDAAVRIKFKTEKHSDFDDFFVRDDAAFLADPLTNNKVVDRRITSSSSYGIGLGYEKFRGNGRLRGIYGAEFGFDFTKQNRTYEYGNTMTSANNAPTTSNFIGGSNQLSTRNINQINPFGNGGFDVGINAFIGIEYFFMPKISIGSELSWGANYHMSTQSSIETEYWNGSAVSSLTTLGSPSEPDFTLGMANPAVRLYVMFHF